MRVEHLAGDEADVGSLIEHRDERGEPARSASTSLLRQTSISPDDARSPALVAAANPLLLPMSRSRARGKSAASISAVPSVEPFVHDHDFEIGERLRRQRAQAFPQHGGAVPGGMTMLTRGTR